MSNTSQNTNKNNKSFGYDRNGKMYKRGKDMVSIMNGFVNEEKRSFVNKISKRILKCVSKAMLLIMACFVMLICDKVEALADGETAKLIYDSSQKTMLFFYDNVEYTVGGTYDYTEGDQTITYNITKIWTDEDVVNSPANGSDLPNWCSIISSVNTVIFDSSFSNAKPKSTQGWFRGDYSYNNKIATIKGLQYLNTSEVTSMALMFCNCASLSELNVSTFNTANVKNMSSMFYGIGLTYLDLSSFNTSKVTSMKNMFYYSQIASVNLNGFDTRNVTNMNSMFCSCQKLRNIDLSMFDTSNVTDMSSMFMNCYELSILDLSGFDTGKVENMGYLFWSCNTLKKIIVSDKFVTTALGTSSNCHYNMFKDCLSLVGGNGTKYNSSYVDKVYARIDSEDTPGYFTADTTHVMLLKKDDVANTLIFLCGNDVYHESDTFIYKNNTYTIDKIWSGASVISTGEEVPAWNTYVNGTLETVIFDRSFVAAAPASMYKWFYGCENLIDVRGMDYINTKSVINMSSMFEGCKRLESIDFGNFYTTSVTDMSSMFKGCALLNRIYTSESFIISETANCGNMFEGCSVLVGGNGTEYDSNYTGREYARIDSTDSKGYFTNKLAQALYLKSGTETNGTTLLFMCGNKIDAGDTFNYNNIEYTVVNAYYGNNVINYIGYDPAWESILYYVKNVIFDESFMNVKPKNLKRWFYHGYYIENITNLQYLNTSEAVSMYEMFEQCERIEELDLRSFDTSNVYDMDGMFQFYDTNNLKVLDVSGFDTSNVQKMSNMFKGCYCLTGDTSSRFDVSNFDTGRVTTMSCMFYDCKGLTSLDVSHFDTSNVTYMGSMFNNCRKLTELDLNSFDTSKVTDMGEMFYSCINLTELDLSSFDTSKVTDMAEMFRNCQKLTTIIVDEGKWKTNRVSSYDSNYVFTGCTNIVGENGTTYDASNVNIDYAHIDTESNPGYLTSNRPRYDITLNTNGGVIVLGNVTKYAEGKGVTLPTEVKKQGYTFKGWYDNENLSGTVVTEIASNEKGNKEFWANWTPITYNVSFNGNGNTSGNMENQTFVYGEEQKLNNNHFVRLFTVTYDYNGATGGNTLESDTANAGFDGWATETTGVVEYGNGDSVSNLTTEDNFTVNLYAKWNDGTVVLPTPTLERYEFKGWYSSSDFEADTLVGIAGEEYAPSADITLYAKWEEKKYTVKWIIDEDNVLETDTNMKYGATPSYDSAAPVKTEDDKYTYSFTGWAPEPVAVTDDITYTAQFYETAKTYGITYHENDGMINGAGSTTYTYGVGATLPEDVTKTGYTFGGWFDNEELTGDAVTVIAPTETGAKEYWAKWEADPVSMPAIVKSNDVTMTYGDTDKSIKVTVEENAANNYSYQWYEKHNTDSSKIIGAEGKEYDIPNNLGVGDYTYFCEVTVERKDINLKETSQSGYINVQVDKKTIVVSGITASDKEYDGNTSATLIYSGINWVSCGMISGDNLSVNATGTFSDAMPGTDKNVVISGLSLGGISVDNYILAGSGNQTSTTASITIVDGETTEHITNSDGSTTIVKTTYAGGVVIGSTETTTSVDGKTEMVVTKDGSGFITKTVEMKTNADETVTVTTIESNTTRVETKDASGNVTKTVDIKTNSDGSTTVIETSYDSEGNDTGCMVTTTSADGKTETVVTKDGSGNTTKTVETNTNTDGTITVTITEGNTTTIETKDASGNVTKTVETKTNADETTTVITTEGSSTTTETKDASGNTTKIVETKTNADGTTTVTTTEGDTTIVETKDVSSNLTKTVETKKNSDGSTTITETSYDSEDNVTRSTETTTSSDGKTEIVVAKDGSGKTTKTIETNVNSDGSTSITDTSYDSEGNVTESMETTISADGKTEMVVTKDGSGNTTKTVETNTNVDGTTTVTATEGSTTTVETKDASGNTTKTVETKTNADETTTVTTTEGSTTTVETKDASGNTTKTIDTKKNADGTTTVTITEGSTTTVETKDVSDNTTKVVETKTNADGTTTVTTTDESKTTIETKDAAGNTTKTVETKKDADGTTTITTTDESKTTVETKDASDNTTKIVETKKSEDGTTTVTATEVSNRRLSQVI